VARFKFLQHPIQFIPTGFQDASKRILIKNQLFTSAKGQKVQLSGKNFEPDWGFYNGTIGNEKEIIFKIGENPLDGTLPQFVLVDFSNYFGPPRMKNNPRHGFQYYP
jgi:hypothetical protein